MSKIKLKMIITNNRVNLFKMNKMGVQQITMICIPFKVHNKKKLMNKTKQKNFKNL